MPDRKIKAIVVILVTVLGVGGIILIVSQSNSRHVPPPLFPPGKNPEIIITNNLVVWAKASYWQNFMPIVPGEGAPFYTAIRVNVTNTGDTTLDTFHAIRVTIYLYGTNMLLVTLNLTLVGEMRQIGPGDTTVLVFTNDRSSIFSPTIEEGTELYSRILTRCGDGIESILTAPPSAVDYTY